MGKTRKDIYKAKDKRLRYAPGFYTFHPKFGWISPVKPFESYLRNNLPDWYYNWYQKEPRWWRNQKKNRPLRRANKKYLHRVLSYQDDGIVPIVGRPWIYYW